MQVPDREKGSGTKTIEIICKTAQKEKNQRFTFYL
jgi:hypothetical protein